MKKLLFFVVALPFVLQAQIEDYYLSNKTPSYKQVIQFYDSISKKSPYFKWMNYGTTDVGIPLHLFVVSKEKSFVPSKINRSTTEVILINNGIHPGEPARPGESNNMRDESQNQRECNYNNTAQPSPRVFSRL